MLEGARQGRGGVGSTEPAPIAEAAASPPPEREASAHIKSHTGATDDEPRDLQRCISTWPLVR